MRKLLDATRSGWAWLDENPHYLFYFVPTILLTVLIGLEVRPGYRTPVWALEAFLLFVAALKMGVRAFRWFSLGLFLFCVARLFAVDIWALDELGRIVSAIGLGAALLLVGFLYARNREAWKKYL